MKDNKYKEIISPLLSDEKIYEKQFITNEKFNEVIFHLLYVTEILNEKIKRLELKIEKDLEFITKEKK